MSSTREALKCMVTMVLGVALAGGGLVLYFKYRRMFLRKVTRVGIVKDILVYPVTAFKGIHGQAVFCSSYGLTLIGVVDREFIVGQSATSGTVTQFYCKEMEDIKAFSDGNNLILSASGKADIRCSLQQHIDSPTRRSILCSNVLIDGFDCGEGVAEWLCRTLSKKGLRLYQCTHSHNKEVATYNKAGHMLVAESTMNEINTQFHFNPPLADDYFRPNIIISGCKPMDENQWDRIIIGQSVTLQSHTSIVRLIEGAYDEENKDWTCDCHPRKQTEGSVCFPAGCKNMEIGVYASTVTEGEIIVGDPVSVIYKPSPFNLLQ